NGAIDDGDLLAATGATKIGTLSQLEPAGTYFVRVLPDTGFSNYQLRINADYASGDGVGVRPMGSLDKLKSFNDFIAFGEGDSIDDYSFTLGTRRPFFAAMSEAGDAGSNAALFLFNDFNHNGVGDADEV